MDTDFIELVLSRNGNADDKQGDVSQIQLVRIRAGLTDVIDSSSRLGLVREALIGMVPKVELVRDISGEKARDPDQPEERWIQTNG